MTTCILSCVSDPNPPSELSLAESEPAAKRARRRDPEASRAAILEAAREVFSERGYTRATIREIAGRAGFTHGLVLRHFGSKEQLLFAAMPGPRDLPGIVAGDPATLPERIAAAVVRQTDVTAGDHAMLALIRSGAEGDAAAVPLYEALEARVMEAFREVLTGPDVDVYIDLLASLLIGITFSRRIARAGALTEMSSEALVSYVAAAIRAILGPVLPAAR
jgi:hypothetical protein